MTSYKELGLVNTREMFKKAVDGGYAIPAFNFNTLEQMQAIVQAAVETKSPVIMQVSKGARNYANGTILRYMAQGAVEYAKELGCPNPQIVLHLDHGDTFELCKDCIDNGFSSVMIDGSSLPYEENIALTKKVVEYAHKYDVTVEAELGVLAAVEIKSPVIMQVSKGARNYANGTILRNLAKGAVEYAKELGCEKPEIVLHLDHGDSFELCKDCIDNGFSSVMIDGSSLPYEDNIALTKKVVEYAHQFDVTVEAELGVLAGVEDEVVAEESHYTKPEEVIDFATRTGCDSLAISIGTSHGAYKFKPEQCTRDPKTGKLVPPPLAFDVLHEIENKLPGFPIVLHGSSSVPQDEVDTINKYGGNLPDAVGIPEEQLREASKSAVCKINIDSDSRLAMTAAIRKYLAEHPDHFDPRQYLKPARENMKKMYIHKIVNVLGSDGKLG